VNTVYQAPTQLAGTRLWSNFMNRFTIGTKLIISCFAPWRRNFWQKKKRRFFGLERFSDTDVKGVLELLLGELGATCLLLREDRFKTELTSTYSLSSFN